MKILFTYFTLFIAVILFTGCSSSSNSIRYTEDKEITSEDDESIRFTSNDKKDDELNMINPDTVSTEYIDQYDVDDMPDDEQGVDISNIIERYDSDKDNVDLSADHLTIKEKLLMEIIKYLNTPYKYGGTTKNGIDCSAFTQNIYSNSFGNLLPRTARDQYKHGKVIDEKEDLKFGDLVFFNTRSRVRPGHVGIYIGDNLFAHASSKNGVIVSSLDHNYYSRRFMGGRRIDGLFSNNAF